MTKKDGNNSDKDIHTRICTNKRILTRCVTDCCWPSSDAFVVLKTGNSSSRSAWFTFEGFTVCVAPGICESSPAARLLSFVIAPDIVADHLLPLLVEEPSQEPTGLLPLDDTREVLVLDQDGLDWIGFITVDEVVELCCDVILDQELVSNDQLGFCCCPLFADDTCEMT